MLLLFAQLSAAAQGCVLARERAADAHDTAITDESCGSLPVDGTVCMLRCLGQDQTDSTPDPHFTAIASSAAVKPLDFTLDVIRISAGVLCDSRLHVPRTPQILFCSYQT